MRLGGAVSRPQVGLASGAFSSLEASIYVKASWMAGVTGVPSSPSLPQNPDASLCVNITPGRQDGPPVPLTFQPLLEPLFFLPGQTVYQVQVLALCVCCIRSFAAQAADPTRLILGP